MYTQGGQIINYDRTQRGGAVGSGKRKIGERKGMKGVNIHHLQPIVVSRIHALRVSGVHINPETQNFLCASRSHDFTLHKPAHFLFLKTLSACSTCLRQCSHHYLHVVLEGLSVTLVSTHELGGLPLENRKLGSQAMDLRKKRGQVLVHLLTLRPHVPDTLLILDEDSVVVQAQ